MKVGKRKLNPVVDPGFAPSTSPGDPIASGKMPSGNYWTLWGWSERGQACIKDRVGSAVGSGGGGEGCGYQLPISETEGMTESDRLMDGVVTPAAARVALERVDGALIDVLVVKPAAVPQFAFWITPMDMASRFDAAIAYDAAGHELGRRRIDPPTEDFAIETNQSPKH
jgi:hypothetical protein